MSSFIAISILNVGIVITKSSPFNSVFKSKESKASFISSLEISVPRNLFIQLESTVIEPSSLTLL